MNAPFLQAGFVRAEIDRLLSMYPELAEDETLRADMIEAETDAVKVIEAALSERQEASAIEAAIASRIDDLVARKQRFVRKAEAMKALVKSVMQAAMLDKLTLPEATLSITKPRTSVNVLNVDDLPQGYFKSVRQADKTAIKAALERGEKIPGAELALGEDGLMVRAK